MSAPRPKKQRGREEREAESEGGREGGSWDLVSLFPLTQDAPKLVGARFTIGKSRVDSTNPARILLHTIGTMRSSLSKLKEILVAFIQSMNRVNSERPTVAEEGFRFSRVSDPDASGSR